MLLFCNLTALYYYFSTILFFYLTAFLFVKLILSYISFVNSLFKAVFIIYIRFQF